MMMPSQPLLAAISAILSPIIAQWTEPSAVDHDDLARPGLGDDLLEQGVVLVTADRDDRRPGTGCVRRTGGTGCRTRQSASPCSSYRSAVGMKSDMLVFLL